MSVQFRNVCGHIEVYDARGEFLFSADTMERLIGYLERQGIAIPE